MSLALIVHAEPTNTDGPALLASTGADNTFYARRLTHIFTNQVWSGATTTVNAFRAYTVANPSQFDLEVGTYRIEAEAMFNQPSGNTSYPIGSVAGLYNVTDAAFEVHAGTSDPIISSAGYVGNNSTITNNVGLVIEGQFDVTGSTKAFSIYQAVMATGAVTPSAQLSTVTGAKSGVTLATHKEQYAYIKILRIA